MAHAKIPTCNRFSLGLLGSVQSRALNSLLRNFSNRSRNFGFGGWIPPCSSAFSLTSGCVVECAGHETKAPVSQSTYGYKKHEIKAMQTFSNQEKVAH